ncbi:uncharacterized protein LOC143536106 [Bidens hawaiensis]|uniref:uncharacterized protein LOC143536106 n=1 Tax=Bidens hawaiensis TaxID=980011 RepID=UPI00404AC63A
MHALMFTINTTPNTRLSHIDPYKMKMNLCLVFALLVLVSYSLAVETSQKDTDKVEPAGGGGGGNWGGGGGGGCHHGCCNQGHHGCQQCCHSPEEAKAYAEKQTKVEPAGGGGGGGNWGGGSGGGGGHWGGGGCHYGCCGRGPYGCQRCCHSLEEAKALVEKQTKVEPAGGDGGGNWGGGGGGGCHYGCCSRGTYGCQRCCHSLEEAKALVEKQAAHP